MPRFQRVNPAVTRTPAEVVERIEQVQLEGREVLKNRVVHGRLLTTTVNGVETVELPMATGGGATLEVPHRLGRLPWGWFQVDINQPIVGFVYRTAWDDRTITFRVRSNWAGSYPPFTFRAYVF